jgi:prepilin-type N-terminal cleavage/methylation domain-containing protein
MRSFASKRAFTLVELLVVIAIIGTLVGLLLPAVQAAREAARRSQCSNNMKQVAVALHNYQDANKTLPPSATNSTVDTKGRQGWSWMLFVLPYIEQASLFDACMNQTTWRMQVPMYMDTAVAAQARAAIPSFVCPTDTVALLAPEAKVNSAASWLSFTSSKSNYLANGGANNTWGGSTDQQVRASQGAFRKVKGATFKDFTDGLSKTFLIGEVGGAPVTASDADKMPGIWSGTTNQNNGQFENSRFTNSKLNSGIADAFGSFHAGGANFAMTDASVRFIDDMIQANPVLWGFDASNDASITNYLGQMSSSSRGVYERLSTRADGQTIGDF